MTVLPGDAIPNGKMCIPPSEWSRTSGLRSVTTTLLHLLSFALVLLTAPISLFFVLKRIPEYERAVVLGTTLSLATLRGPGLIFVLPFLEKVKRVDIRTRVFEVPPQQILSTDSVTLTVDAVIFYRVFEPVRAACILQDYDLSIRGLASSTLGSILGTYTLSALLSERESIASKVMDQFTSACSPWGICVERVEVKSLSVAKDMVKGMAIEAKTAREANGLLIIQEGESKCLEKMKKGADEMQVCPTSMTLKYLQVLNGISKEHNNTVVLPIPKSILRHLGSKDTRDVELGKTD